MFRVALAFLLLGLTTGNPVCGLEGEEKIDLSKVPTQALAAAKGLFPKGKYGKTATKVTDDGEVTYQIALRHAKEDYEVTVTEDGTVTEVARDVPFEKLPKAVIAGVEKAHPKAKVSESAELTVPGEKGKKYYVELTTAQGAKRKLTLESDGTVEEDEE